MTGSVQWHAPTTHRRWASIRKTPMRTVFKPEAYHRGAQESRHRDGYLLWASNEKTKHESVSLTKEKAAALVNIKKKSQI